MKVSIFSGVLDEETEKSIEIFHNGNQGVPFFQSVGFFKTTLGIRKYRPVFFVVTDDESNIVATMLAHHIRIVAFKCSLLSYTLITGGPVFSHKVNNKDEILGQLLDKLKQQFSTKSLFTEFRNLSDLSIYKSIFEKEGFIHENWLNSTINTADAKVMFSGVQKNKQTQIKEANASGIMTRPVQNEDEVRSFYLQLKRFYTFSLHKPLPPLQIFINLYRMAVANSAPIPVIVSVYKGRIIGGMICPYDEHSMYEWYICTENQGNTDLYTGVATTWGGIEYANQRGLHYFNFLGLGKPEKEYGVRRFKRQFGGEESNYGRFIFYSFKTLSKALRRI